MLAKRQRGFGVGKAELGIGLGEDKTILRLAVKMIGRELEECLQGASLRSL